MNYPPPQLNIDDLEVDRKQIRNILHRFTSLNEKRLNLLFEHAEDTEADFIKLLPLLFHINHPTLPGFVNSDVAHGIVNYCVNKESILLGKKYARSLSYKQKPSKFRDIEAIFLMGSAGSIAYTGQSDLDIWVCYRTGLSEQQVTQLQKKRDLIQKWASSLGIDSSIYLVNESSFLDIIDETDDSNQPALLLDEFYRTMVHLGGKYPLWWIIPSQWNHQYEEYKENLIANRYILTDDWIDFGTVTEVPPKEFISSILWYLNKALMSPYKTALKLVLMESYTYQYPKTLPLSLEYKNLIYNYIDNATVIDSYLLMYRKVEEYLTHNDQMDRLEYIRRCLYHKISARISRTLKTKVFARQTIADLVKEWQWEQDKVTRFDKKNQWSIHDIGNEKRLYIKQLIASFKHISEFIRHHKSLFEQHKQQLVCLSRKLAARLELTHGKIELMNINFVPNLDEKHLSVVRQAKSKDMELWSLYDHPVSQNAAQSIEPLYQCNSLIELLVWSRVNGLLNESTAIQFRDSLQLLHYGELEKIIRQLFKERVGLGIANDRAYEQPPLVDHISVYINVAHDQLTEMAKKGVHLITRQSDPLSYGQTSLNLIESLELVYNNSWQELFVVKYSGYDSLAQSIISILELCQRQKKVPSFKFHCFSSMRAEAIVARIHKFIANVIFYYTQQNNLQMNFVFKLGAEYRLIHQREESFAYIKASDRTSLGRHLISHQGRTQQIKFDPYSHQQKPLQQAYSCAKPGSHLLSVTNKSADVVAFCFLDTLGGVVFWQIPSVFETLYLKQLAVFIQQFGEQCPTLLSQQGHTQAFDTHITSEEELGLALSVFIYDQDKRRKLSIQAASEQIELEESDRHLQKKFASWLERCFYCRTQETYIKELDIDSCSDMMTASHKILEKHLLESLLGCYS